MLPKGFRFEAPPLDEGTPESVRAAVETLRMIKSASQKKLEAWASERDERVIVALLESHPARPRTKSNRTVVTNAWGCVLARAEASAEVWTPGLDRISAIMLRDHYYRRDTEKLEQYITQTLVPALGSRIKRPAQLLGLIEGTRSVRFLFAVAEHAIGEGIWTEDAVRALERRLPRAIEVLAANPSLDEAASALVLDLLVEQQLAPRVDGRATPDNPLEVQARSGYMIRTQPDKALEHLYEGGARLTRAQLRRLVGVDERGEPSGERERERRYPFQASRLLHQHLFLTGDSWAGELIASAAGHMDAHSVEQMLWPSSALLERGSRFRPTVDMHRAAVLAAPRSGRILAAAAADEHARRDPEIRAVLLKSRSADVVKALLCDCDESEFVTLFRAAAVCAPAEAARLLTENRDLAERLLTRKDVVRLLKSDDQTARLLAITVAPALPLKRTANRSQSRGHAGGGGSMGFAQATAPRRARTRVG